MALRSLHAIEKQPCTHSSQCSLSLFLTHTHDTLSLAAGEPVSTTYRGRTVSVCAPPGRGVQVLECLNILEGYPIGSGQPGWGHNEPETVHHFLEATKLAAADRAVWVRMWWWLCIFMHRPHCTAADCVVRLSGEGRRLHPDRRSPGQRIWCGHSRRPSHLAADPFPALMLVALSPLPHTTVTVWHHCLLPPWTMQRPPAVPRSTRPVPCRVGPTAIVSAPRARRTDSTCPGRSVLPRLVGEFQLIDGGCGWRWRWRWQQ